MKKINKMYVLIAILLCLSFYWYSVKMQSSIDKKFGEVNITANPNEISSHSSQKKSDCRIFEGLSKAERDRIVDKNKKQLNKDVLSYYDTYSNIKNLDTIFLLVNECNTDDIDLAPFYLYVVSQLAQNSDGYVGETINNYFYKYLCKFPEYIYPYLGYLNGKKHKRYKGLLYSIINEIDGAEISNVYLDSIFDKHRQLCPDYRIEIDSISAFIFKNKN
jgi:hypothetical protein